MFKTIKSKITAITLSVFLALIIVMSYYAYIYLTNSESLITESCDNTVSAYAQRINKAIARVEDNAEDLSLTGVIYFSSKNLNIARQVIKETFTRNYQGGLGGGIWFEPYIIDKKTKMFRIYVYKNEQDEVSYDTLQFNYFNRIWYKQLSTKLKKEHGVVWSTPYADIRDNKTLVITAGKGMYNENGEFIGLSSVDCKISEIKKYLEKMVPTSNSFLLLGDSRNNCIIISTDKYLDNDSLIGQPIVNIPWLQPTKDTISYFKYHGVNYISYMQPLDNDMFLIVNVPKKELFFIEYVKVGILFLALFIISIILVVLLYVLLKRNIIKPIDKLISVANIIGEGRTDVDIKIENPKEFAHLAATFDNMTKNLKTITADKERIISELSIAKAIQASSLPDVEKVSKEQKEFELYASMEPAKDVGGDFYDCFFIDDEHFLFLIADVSGKGIPAALFMMTVITLINNLSKLGYKPQELIEIINRKICDNNKQGLFVTMFSGIVNIKTGKMTCVNCGHNPPLLTNKDGNFEYLNLETNTVLGAFKDFEFKISEYQLGYDDTIFLYTDGITEAFDKNGQLFGEENLLKLLNQNKGKNVRDLAKVVNTTIKDYMGSGTQSDDITMLIFQYKNNTENKKVYENLAIKENYNNFYKWIHSVLNEWQINEDLINKIDMCAEEIFANITFYSYGNNHGKITVITDKAEKEITFTFEDEGMEYNPLKKPDPDITLPAEERQLGGLGIFMVKEIADYIDYEYKDKKNILTIKFKLQ